MQIRLLIFFIWSLCITSTQAQTTWAEKSGIPVSRCIACGFSIGNYGYVGTGIVNGRLGNDFWKYDPLTDTWTEIDSMPTLGRRGAFSFSIGNKGYVGGGVNSHSLTDDEFWEYDADRSAWTRKANMPSGLVYSSETLVGFSIGANGYLLAAINRSNFYMYNPSSDTWSKMENFPGPKALDQMGFSIGGKGYIGSGFGNNTYYAEFWEYDPANNQWSRKADVPGQPRTDAVGFSVGNYGYFGLGTYRTDLLFDFWEYHPLTDTWIQIDSCGYAAWYALGIGIGSKGYMGTGVRFSDDSGWWEYTPNVSSTNNIGESCLVNIYPNPVRDNIHIDTREPGPITVSVYSIMGRLVKSALITDRIVPASELPVGVYTLKIRLADQVVSKKFVKE